MQEIELPAVDTWSIIITLAFIIFDFASGICKAYKAKNISSTIMREGLYHKGAYVGIIALAFLAQWGSAHMELGFTIPLTAAACAYISLTEITSILENLAELNPELKENPVFKIFDTAKED